VVVSSPELLLEAAVLDQADWDARVEELKVLPPTETLPALISCMQASELTALRSISDIDRTIVRIASLAFDLVCVAVGESRPPAVESMLGRISEVFSLILRSWCGQDRWRGEFVPKASAYDLAMKFALAVEAPGRPDLHPPFRQAAKQLSDTVLAAYILDVVCGDAR
jgi:hypothetical protein